MSELTVAEIFDEALGRDPVGAGLLDELDAAVADYVVLPDDAARHAIALWIAATHIQHVFEHATRLVIKSPEKRCGKSRLMDIVEATCHDPLITVNISPAALVRSIGDTPPTLLLDEADTVFGKKAGDNNEDLRGILNAGHQRNRPYIRWDPTLKAKESCPTFSMAALAGIGSMPETIEDRAVIVLMRRRAPGEVVKPYRTRRDRPRLTEIGERLGEWASTVADTLVDAEPVTDLEDRAYDTWESLLLVADAAGGHWPARARAASTRMTSENDDEDADRSLGVRLLTDVKVIADRTAVSFIKSQDLLGELKQMPESPWGDFELTARRLAQRLKPFGVHPGSTGTVRGYRLADFEDAFSRYLSRQGDVSEPVKRLEPTETLGSTPDGQIPSDASSVSPERTVSPKSPETLGSDGSGGSDGYPTDDEPTVCRNCSADLWAPQSRALGICGRCAKTEGATA